MDGLSGILRGRMSKGFADLQLSCQLIRITPVKRVVQFLQFVGGGANRYRYLIRCEILNQLRLFIVVRPRFDARTPTLSRWLEKVF
jgi:hypothetical protein